MKVILSRKGFDSENGGMPSPIMPNGDVVSFPIPSQEPIRFSDLRYGRETYSDILSDLTGVEDADLGCHFDPDLEVTRRKTKPKKWVPAFGQDGSSVSYLRNTVKIEPDDLFLFFGWYHRVEKVNGVYRYVKKSGDFYADQDLHLIWGYMQVGEIVSDYKEKARRFPWHPHTETHRQLSDTDTIFVARPKLSFAPDLPGAGLLPYNIRRVLTKLNESKAVWNSNPVYMPNSIIGNRKNSAKGDGVYYSGVWQELALKETKAAEKWAKQIVLA